METLAVVRGALHYEFRMQVRRHAVWVVIGFLGLFLVLLWYGQASDYLTGFYRNPHGAGPHEWVPPSTTTAVLYWATMAALFLPVGIGLVLADRLVRDRETHVDELFQTASGRLSARLAGKYLGTTLATLVPVAMLYAAGVAYMLSRRPDGHALAVAALAFPLLLFPAALFVAGFSLACPLVMKVPIYQFLFIGYWFWGNVLPQRVGIPTLAHTLLDASGAWADKAFFSYQLRVLTATPLQAVVNITLLLGLGLFALAAASGYLHWRQMAQ
jgi:ABC-2 type transport system permease protein